MKGHTASNILGVIAFIAMWVPLFISVLLGTLGYTKWSYVFCGMALGVGIGLISTSLLDFAKTLK